MVEVGYTEEDLHQGACCSESVNVKRSGSLPVRWLIRDDTRKHSGSCRYPVRMALIDLDNPPRWWGKINPDFLTAQEARDLVSMTGEASSANHLTKQRSISEW